MDANSLHQRGLIALEQGNYELAVELIGQAIAQAKDNAVYHCNLGAALKAQGKLDVAVALYERALVLRPNYAEAHNNLGVALKERGELDRAIEHYGRAVAIKPDYAQAHYNLGTALRLQGRLDAAALCYERALVLRQDYAEAHNNLAVVLHEQGKLADAVTHYEHALRLRPDNANTHNNLAIVLREQGKLEDAVAHFERVLAISPRQAEVQNSLGNLCKELGRFDEALAHFGRALALRPDYAEAHFNRALIKTFRTGDPELEALEALAVRADLSRDQALSVHFALAKAREDCGDALAGFAHVRQGNALKRAQIRYDEVGTLGLMQRIAAIFDSGLLTRLAGAGDPCLVPIFVLGMPRSGSTLVEQILASHPQIQGAGELMDLEQVTATMPGKPAVLFPDYVPRLDANAVRRLGETYLGRLPPVAQGKTRVVDKLPYNFLRIGLIRLILPNARIVHTTRDPVATCVSCYSTLFTYDNEYSYDLAELGRYYRGYRELMAHWRSVLTPGTMLEIAYEEVVDDLEGQARRLIDYCGLPWDEHCISFHQTSRPIQTASAVQARRPLYRSALERWRAYESELAPLLRALGDVI